MPRVMSLGHIGLYVRDIERSKAFYRDILGLKVSDESASSGAVFMTARDRLEEHHELLLLPGREEGKVIQQISFRCASLAAVKDFYQVFLRHKIPINRVVSHGNAIGIYFQNPDGNQSKCIGRPALIGPSPSASRLTWRRPMRRSSRS